MSAMELVAPPKRAVGRPPGGRNGPDAQKTGPKPKLVTGPKSKLVTQASKVGKITEHRTPRRVDLHGSDADLDTTQFSGRIASARLAAGLTQEELGKSIGRTRQSILQYERGASFPPIDVIEALAQRLGVSSTYLAFGEHAVRTTKADLVVNIDEITYGKDGRFTSGSFVIPRALAESYVEDIRGLKVFSLNHNAPLFGLSAGDRLFVNTRVTEMTLAYDIYAVEIGGEMEIVRYTTSPKKDMVAFIDPKNSKSEVKAKDIKVLGPVVSTLSRK